MSKQAPKSIPKTVVKFAVKHRIPLKLVWVGDGDWYYAAGQEMTRTAQPRSCHALAMCRRYLGSNHAQV